MPCASLLLFKTSLHILRSLKRKKNDGRIDAIAFVFLREVILYQVNAIANNVNNEDMTNHDINYGLENKPNVEVILRKFAHIQYVITVK